MSRQDLVALDALAAAAYGLDPGTRLPVGCWLTLPDGQAIRVEPDGALLPRPTPLPWSRPSWAAIPSLAVRR